MWAQVVVSTHLNCTWTLCGHCDCLGQVLYLGRTPRTKETLPDFFVSGVGLSSIHEYSAG